MYILRPSLFFGSIPLTALSITASGLRFNSLLAVSSRFSLGVSGNPKGRPKREGSSVAEGIRSFLDSQVEYREGGRVKVATHREIALRNVVDSAVRGDLGAAALVLKIVARAERYGGRSADRILVRNWLPDYPGQTAGQKAAQLAVGRFREPARHRRASED